MMGPAAEVHGRDAGQCVWRWQAWRVLVIVGLGSDCQYATGC